MHQEKKKKIELNLGLFVKGLFYRFFMERITQTLKWNLTLRYFSLFIKRNLELKPYENI